MATIVITEFMGQDAVSELEAHYDVLYDANLCDRTDDLFEAVSDCSAVIVRNRTQVRQPLLDHARALQVVGRLGVGLDNIDIASCQQRGIEVFPATGANNLSVAEYVITALLLLFRGAYRATDAVLAGEWPRNALIGREVSGKCLGLIGFGGIARDVATRAQALGMQVVASDPYVADDDPAWQRYQVEPMSMEQLLRVADAVSLHVPLSDETRHQIDSQAMAKMKPQAILINAARGAVVDEPALAAALRSGHLGGAMLDVFEHEPLARGSVFEEVPNLVLTPHIAGVTQESNVRVSNLIASRVREALQKKGVTR